MNRPIYAQDDIKSRLLANGASGTVYALVMPEVNEIISKIVDGHLDGAGAIMEGTAGTGRDRWHDRYMRPWESRQDVAHQLYFETWEQWAKPVVGNGPQQFSSRYPTAGASEGIMKILAEFRAEHDDQYATYVHVFEGEYEGITSYAEAMNLYVIRHNRDDWRHVKNKGIMHGHGMNSRRHLFMLSQPSAIDGNIWADFNEFVEALNTVAPKLRIVPDLTYVGATRDTFSINLDSPNIPAFVMSQSKPFGVYYHRIGGVYSRQPMSTLIGNVWFKNLLSLDIGIEVMRAFHVYELPRTYSDASKKAFKHVEKTMELENARHSDVFLLASATTQPGYESLDRENSGRMRICLTPTMSEFVNK